MMEKPTERTYGQCQNAFDWFNQALFDKGKLPHCMITLQERKGSYGYFHGLRWTDRKQGEEVMDEIALNPQYFSERTTEEFLSTLAHEMVHGWQQHFGWFSPRGYHNLEWAKKMEEIGLMPSDTGAEGGKKTGYRVSHYIILNGPFERACHELILNGFDVPYVHRDLLQESIGKGKGVRRKRKRSTANKTKYCCPNGHVNAWAKPSVKLMCGECRDSLTEIG